MPDRKAICANCRYHQKVGGNKNTDIWKCWVHPRYPELNHVSGKIEFRLDWCSYKNKNGDCQDFAIIPTPPRKNLWGDNLQWDVRRQAWKVEL